MKRFNDVTHVIFDVDGLLLDTETIYTKMMNILASRYDKTFTWDVKVKMMGKRHQESAQVFIDELQVPITVDEYSKQLRELMPIHFPTSELLPGADRLVRHLRSHRVPMALATGSHQSELGLKTSQHQELFSLFDHVVCSSDDPEVKRGKPAPDCFVIAGRRFRDSPSSDKVLVFEDAPNGVEGALAAGMQVVWVPDPKCLETIEKAGGSVPEATMTLSSLDDFDPVSFALPAYT